MKTDAYLSEDRQYRYWLRRVWAEEKALLCVIGVNPSTADERENDATIRKDIGFARRLGFGGILMLNVGAYRSRDPLKWRQAPDMIGPENSAEHLKGYVKRFRAAKVVAAWGKNGNYAIAQCESIIGAFPELWCWGLNQDATPVHPLMLSYSTPLRRFRE